MIVQIYEVTSLVEAKELAQLEVDHIGVLVGKGKFPRELNFNQAKRIFDSLGKESKKVALCITSDLKEIIKVVEKTNPDILHLCALPKDLHPAEVKKIKQKFPNLKIMRTVPVIDKESIKLAKEYEGAADFLLLDSYKKRDKGVGATGKVHNWGISKEIVERVKIPVILAGGLGPENVAEAIKKVRPAGVDSKTKTDRVDGNGKDLNKVKEFVRIAKAPN